MKRLLVLGAGPGIGLETARRFGRAGFEVVLASRQPEKLRPQIDGLRGEGIAVASDSIDLADGPAVTRFVERLAGTLDVLLYNAAVMRFGPTLDQVAPETLDGDLQVDLASALRAIKAVQPGLAARGGGSILLTGGSIVDNPSPVALTMSAGKAGLRAAAQALFEPFRAQNIHIAVLTVGARVVPESREAGEIAQAFWEMHSAPANAWTWERRYP